MILPTYTDFRYCFTANKTIRAKDGYPIYDLANVTNVPIALPTQLSTFTFPTACTVNGGAADAVPGVDEYDWYLSQQSDDPAKQYLQPLQAGNGSGSILILLSTLGLATWNPTTTDNVLRLVFDVGIYARQRSSGKIYFGDLMRSLFAKY